METWVTDHIQYHTIRRLSGLYIGSLISLFLYFVAIWPCYNRRHGVWKEAGGYGSDDLSWFHGISAMAYPNYQQKDTWIYKGKGERNIRLSKNNVFNTQKLWFSDFLGSKQSIIQLMITCLLWFNCDKPICLLLIHSARTYWAKGSHGMLPSCEISIARKWSINQIVFQNI